MSDSLWNTQPDQHYETLEPTAEHEVQICVAAENADSDACTVNLTELRQLLEAEEFQLLKDTLTRYIYETRRFDQCDPAKETENEPTGPYLTCREQEVMQLIVRGYRSQEMGTLLEISTHTITTHIKNMYRKLKVSSRSEAIFEAFQQGLIQR